MELTSQKANAASRDEPRRKQMRLSHHIRHMLRQLLRGHGSHESAHLRQLGRRVPVIIGVAVISRAVSAISLAPLSIMLRLTLYRL